MTLGDVTVLVPLHRSEPFLDVVEANLRRLAPACRIVVSDATGCDDALERLQRHVGPHPSIAWLGPRPIAPGWVAHYDELRTRVATPSFLWLPHDDEIEAGYVARCRRLLDSGPDVVAATGVIDAATGRGLFQPRQIDLAHVDTSRTYASEANRLLFEWNLGIPFRSVFRTRSCGPIAHTDRGDRWADIVWLYGLCLEHRVVQDRTARYRKRFYDDSTHAGWRLPLHPNALPHLHREVLRRPWLPDRDAILAELVARATAAAGRLATTADARLRRAERRAARATERAERAVANRDRAVARMRRLEERLGSPDGTGSVDRVRPWPSPTSSPERRNAGPTSGSS